MHRTVKDKLSRAQGVSQQVIAIFVDVRGFTTFSGMQDSSSAALFLKSMYLKILTHYFPDVSYFKLTGDGLMIIRAYDESTLHDLLNDSVHASIKLVEDFPTICEDDQMIVFEVPKLVGIGISRGSATQLRSDDETLDYSGRPLNLAARLMDLARPNGLVIDDRTIGKGILEDNILAQLSSADPFIKGIHEEKPVSVKYQTSNTVIDKRSLLPINKYKPVVLKAPACKPAELIIRAGNYSFPITEEPADPSACKVTASFPKYSKGRKTTYRLLQDFPTRYEDSVGRRKLIVDCRAIHAYAIGQGVKRDTLIELEFSYLTVDRG